MLRFPYILSLIIKYSFIYLLLKLGLYKKPKQKILRNFLEEAGGSFIKLGQILAIRVDFLPKEYTLELMDMFDNVKPFSYKEVEETFRQELGTTPDKIFKDFQKVPFASASFGQVHGAKLQNDHIVAVKIMRPGIEPKVLSDFLIIDIIAFAADIFFKFEALPWKEFAQEFKRWTREELDYHIEAAYLQTLNKSMEKREHVVIPKVYPHLSTKRIITEDYIEGLPLSKVILGFRDGRLNEEILLKKYDIDIKKIPNVLTQEIFRQFFLDGIFHADPHPGNILLLKGSNIALLDFGIVGNAEMPNGYWFTKFIMSIPEKDIKKPIYCFASFVGYDLKNMIASALPATISNKSIDDFMDILSDYFAETVSKISVDNRSNVNNLKKDYARVYFQVFKEAAKFRIKIPKQSVLLFRVLSIIGLLSKEMNRKYSGAEEITEFFSKYGKTVLAKNEYNVMPYQRIKYERAIEQLNGWLTYLIEVDPRLYQVVKQFMSKYTLVDK